MLIEVSTYGVLFRRSPLRTVPSARSSSLVFSVVTRGRASPSNMATRVTKTTKTTKKRAQGRSAGAVDKTWVSGHEHHDTILDTKRGINAAGYSVRHRGSLTEVNIILSELTKTIENAKKTPSRDGFFALVIHAHKLLAVAQYIAPEGFTKVIRLYAKKIMPIETALYARCGSTRVVLDP